MSDTQNGIVALNLRRLGHLDIPGGGQVTVQGKTAFVGHIDPPHGTSIIDVSDGIHKQQLREWPRHILEDRSSSFYPQTFVLALFTEIFDAALR